jgi:hypothetical protein
MTTMTTMLEEEEDEEEDEKEGWMSGQWVSKLPREVVNKKGGNGHTTGRAMVAKKKYKSNTRSVGKAWGFFFQPEESIRRWWRRVVAPLCRETKEAAVLDRISPARKSDRSRVFPVL